VAFAQSSLGIGSQKCSNPKISYQLGVSDASARRCSGGFGWCVHLGHGRPCAGGTVSCCDQGGQNWKHALTGTVLPPRIGDFVRADVVDYGKVQLDVAATYNAGPKPRPRSISIAQDWRMPRYGMTAS
jgi:hypothetical protein